VKSNYWKHYFFPLAALHWALTPRMEEIRLNIKLSAGQRQEYADTPKDSQSTFVNVH